MSNLILGMFAILAIVVVVLTLVVVVKMNRKIAHNKAMLEAHQKLMEEKRASKDNPAGQPIGEGEKKEDSKPGADRSFTPSS